MKTGTYTALKIALGLSESEWRCVKDAAKDARMKPRDYCRMMVLAAAGMGGVVEHLKRAIDASERVGDGGMPWISEDDVRPY